MPHKTMPPSAPVRPIFQTRFVKEALRLAAIVRDSSTAKIGEIVGPAGCGKTTAGGVIAQQFAGVRVCAFDGMTRHQLARQIATRCGICGAGAVDRLLSGADANQAPQFLVVDEANKLNWRTLELLRYLSDECAFTVVLIGTDMFERQFTSPRTKDLLIQLGSRIGAKRIKGNHLDRAETYAHVIKPLLGDVDDKHIVNNFWLGCRRGNFREAIELADECRRVMASNQFATLTPAVVEVAVKWMANRHSAASAGDA